MALDCQNVDSTLVSVAALFSIGKQELRTALTNLSFSAFEESLRNSLKPPDRMLWDRFPGAGTPSPVPAMIYSLTFHFGPGPVASRRPARPLLPARGVGETSAWLSFPLLRLTVGYNLRWRVPGKVARPRSGAVSALAR